MLNDSTKDKHILQNYDDANLTLNVIKLSFQIPSSKKKRIISTGHQTPQL